MSSLRELREQRGMTQKELAHYLGISRSTYARYEQNPDMMSIVQALRICQLMNCDIDELFPVDVRIANILRDKSF